MPKKRAIKKHSVRANLSVKELTKAGSSLEQRKNWNVDPWQRFTLLVWQETTHSKAYFMESICRDDGRVGLRALTTVGPH
jgi:hypothetical protein